MPAVSKKCPIASNRASTVKKYGGISKKSAAEKEKAASQSSETQQGMTQKEALRLAVKKKLISGEQHINEFAMKDMISTTALHRCAQADQVENVEILLAAGAALNVKTRADVSPNSLAFIGGKTALQLAVENNSVATARLLIEAGADVHEKDEDGDTALHIAAEKSVAMAMLLIEANVNVNEVDEDNRTPLHRACFATPMLSGQMARLLLNAGANVHAKDKKGNAALHLATAADNTTAVNVLIKGGARVNDKNKKQRTPLHNAAFNHEFPSASSQATKLLLNASADVHAADEKLFTPLHLATGKDSLKTAELLIRAGANVNARNAFGSSPLHGAGLRRSAPVTTLLLSEHADPHAKDNDGDTALHNTPCLMHWAGERADILTAQLLIEAGVNVSEANCDRITPLHKAAANGSAELAVLLLAAKADPNAKDACGRTPLRTPIESEACDCAYDCLSLARGRVEVRKVLERAHGTDVDDSETRARR